CWRSSRWSPPLPSAAWSRLSFFPAAPWPPSRCRRHRGSRRRSRRPSPVRASQPGFCLQGCASLSFTFFRVCRSRRSAALALGLLGLPAGGLGFHLLGHLGPALSDEVDRCNRLRRAEAAGVDQIALLATEEVEPEMADRCVGNHGDDRSQVAALY